jgi:hypothetical protein
MKNTIKFFAIAALALTMILTSCDNGTTTGGDDDDPASALKGKWYTSEGEVYDFRSDGKLFTAGVDSSMTYTVSGNTITLFMMGNSMGTATFSIAGTGTAAKLTLSTTATPAPGLIAGTYSRSTGGGDVPSKPGPGGGIEHLSSSATASQALAKLNEIIAHPDTPTDTKELAQMMKDAMPTYTLTWSTSRDTVIAAINALIDEIPGGSDIPKNTALIGKWYKDTDEAYDFQSDGKLIIAGADQGFTYTESGSTIAVSMLVGGNRFELGTATFSITASGETATLTLSNISPTVPLTVGTYTRGNSPGGTTQEYAVIYALNGGYWNGQTPQTQKYKSGQSVEVWPNAPSKSGLDFIRWDTNSSGYGTAYQPGSTFTIWQNTTLYAIWEEGEIDIPIPTDPELSYITADYWGSDGLFYPTTPLNNLKEYLTVTAYYNNGDTNVLEGNKYTLSGTLKAGECVITAYYQGQSTTFSVWLTEENPGGPVSLSHISVSYPTDLAIYSTSDLTVDKLKEYLTVTAHYSNGTTFVLTYDKYTLSMDGWLSPGSHVITARYEGKSTTFNINVNDVPPEHTHEFIWAVTVPPTCESEGQQASICTICGGGSQTAVIPALDHAWSEWTRTGEDEETRFCYYDNSHYETRSVSVIPVCTISYFGNGGNGEDFSILVAIGGGYTIPYETGHSFYPPEGLVFSAWNTASDGSGTYYNPNDSFVVTYNLTLYAIWK